MQVKTVDGINANSNNFEDLGDKAQETIESGGFGQIIENQKLESIK